MSNPAYWPKDWPALLPELYHHTLFSLSSHGVYIEQRYWSCGSFVHLSEKPLHQKRQSTGDPRTTSMYISSSIILPVSSGWNNILSSKWLQWGSITTSWHTHSSHSAVISLISLWRINKCESPMMANHDMIRRKGFTTYTIIRDVGQSSTILKMHGIPEFTFGQMEILITKRENHQPCWRALLII